MSKMTAFRAARHCALALSCALAVLAAPAAWAHAHLQQSVPAANAAVAAPARIELRFNEALVERFAKVTLQFLGADGKGQPQDVDGVALAFADDKRGVIATPAQPLPAGRYRVLWRVVSADTHPIKGQFEFTVK